MYFNRLWGERHMSIINGFSSSGGSSNNNYELMTLSQENISEQITTGTVYCKIAQNNASINECHSPLAFEIGKHSKKAPAKMKTANPSKIYFAGVILKIF